MEEEFYIPKEKITFQMKALRFYFQRLGWLMPAFTSRFFWKLFTSPRKRTISSNGHMFLEQAISREFSLSDSNIRYILHQFGDDPPAVLICHGWEGMTVDFQNIIQALTGKGVGVLSIDFPGHGTSSPSQAHLPLFADVILEVLKAYSSLESVLGHSLGAASLAVASGENEAVFKSKKLIFLGLHPVPSSFFLKYKSVTRINDRLFKKCVSYAEKKVGRNLISLDCYVHLEVFDSFDILFIHDSKDRIIHVKRLEEFAEQLPKASLFQGDHGGHFKHYRHPQVVDEIVSFVQRLR